MYRQMRVPIGWKLGDACWLLVTLYCSKVGGIGVRGVVTESVWWHYEPAGVQVRQGLNELQHDGLSLQLAQRATPIEHPLQRGAATELHDKVHDACRGVQSRCGERTM